jgi:hypothetical protein
VAGEKVVDFRTLWVAVEWVRRHCVIPDGHMRGDPYDPVEWQEWFLLNHYRVRRDAPLPSESRPAIGAPAFFYRRSQIVTPQKALALDTPVATPSGWSTMGDLRVGDLVFANDGTPTEVVGKSPVWDVPTYRVVFDDGAELVACGDHEWLVEARPNSGARHDVRMTTSQLRDARLRDRWGSHGYRVANPAPLDLPEVDLPVHAYVAGVASTMDRERRGGFRPEVSRALAALGADPAALGGDRLGAVLRGSAGQRLAALVGVMDSAGYVEAGKRRCEVVLLTEDRVDDLTELLASLGLRYTVGRVRGGRFRVRFVPHHGMTVTTVGWLRDRLGHGVRRSYVAHRRIVSVEPCERVPTQCITVAHPSHSFLAGREMIVTGNSGKGPLSAAQIALEGVGPALFAGWATGGEVYDCADHGCPCGWGYEYEPGEAMGSPWPTPLIQVTAYSVEQAANVYDAFRAMVEYGPLGEFLPKPAEDFARLPNGGRIDRVTSSQQSRLGQRVTFVMQDEALALDTPIRTTAGWSTMGDLAAGDVIIGSDGRPTTVTRATGVQHGRECFRVSFGDGTSIVASDGHLWATGLGVRTTGELFRWGGVVDIPAPGGGWETVASIEPVRSVPVRCVAVDADDHLFLAGEGMHVTHNTGIWLKQNKMDKVATTQRRGAAGMQGRVVETTNAWSPADHSVAQSTYEASLKVGDIFRYHPTAPQHLSFRDRRERMQILRHVYEGCWWNDLGAINAEAEEIMIEDPAQAERFFGNNLVAGRGSWMDPDVWAATLRPRDVPPGTPVAVGFDGSDSDDWTALRCVTMDGYHFTPTYGPDDRPTYWDPAEWGGSIPRGEVAAAVDAIANRYVMRRLYADPRDWRTEIGEWSLKYGDKVVLEWATYRIVQMHTALKQTFEDYRAGLATHDGCVQAGEHMLHAKKAACPGDRYILAKPTQHQKIDIAMADVLAHVAAYDLKVSKQWEPQRKGLTRARGRAR